MCMMHKTFAIEKTKEDSKALFMVSKNQLSCDPNLNHTTYLNCQSRFLYTFSKYYQRPSAMRGKCYDYAYYHIRYWSLINANKTYVHEFPIRQVGDTYNRAGRGLSKQSLEIQILTLPGVLKIFWDFAAKSIYCVS